MAADGRKHAMHNGQDWVFKENGNPKIWNTPSKITAKAINLKINWKFTPISAFKSGKYFFLKTSDIL